MTMAMDPAMKMASTTCRKAAPGMLAPAAGAGAGDPPFAEIEKDFYLVD
jgi:hypothetical protein